MGDLKLQGSHGMWNDPVPLKHREANANTTFAQIKAATKENNLDELVVTDKNGTMHVVYADELNVKDGKLPKPGTEVELSFIDGPVTVEYVDDEIKEDTYAAMGGLGLLLSDKTLNLDGDDSALRKLTHDPGKSAIARPTGPDTTWTKAQLDQELKWAEKFSEDVANGAEGTRSEINRYEASQVAMLKAQGYGK